MASPNEYGQQTEREQQPEGGRLAKALRMIGAVGFTPELPLMLGTAMTEMAGKGLGTLAGMAGSKLRGEPIDWDAAADTARDIGAFTYQPRTRGANEALEAAMPALEAYDNMLHEGGAKVAEVTGSPAIGAYGYAMSSLMDPWDMVPIAGTAAALRKAGQLARSVPPVEVKSTGFGGKERGAYSSGDLAQIGGDFELRSPTLDAFDRLKPQEQGRLPGRQLIQALRREGASKEELLWSGLDRLLDTDEVISVAEARAAAQQNAPQFEWERKGGDPDSGGGMDPDEFNEAVSERAREYAWEDDNLEYAENWTIFDNDMSDDTGWTGRTEYDAQNAVEEMIANDREYFAETFREERGQIRDFLEELEREGEIDLADYGVDDVADLSDDVVDALGDKYADDYAERSVDESRYTINNEPDYESEPLNIDELTDYWENEIRGDPQQYGVDGNPNTGDEPSWGEYTVSREQGLTHTGRGDAYQVNLANLLREGLYGRGNMPAGGNTSANTPEGFVGTYLDDPVLRQREIDRILERGSLVNQPDFNPAIAGTPEQARRGRFESGHYDANMFFTRETTPPMAPDWGSPEATRIMDEQFNRPQMRIVEEIQSDAMQRGRKSGWIDPLNEKTVKKQKETLNDVVDENARTEAYKRQALNEATTARRMHGIPEYLQELLDTGTPGAEIVHRYLERAEAAQGSANIGEQLSAEFNFWSNLETTARHNQVNPEIANFAAQMESGLNRLTNMDRINPAEKVPAAPMRESRQYIAHALRDSLARAVQGGEQFFAISSPDTHIDRWGSDSVQWGQLPAGAQTNVTHSKYSSGRDARGQFAEKMRDYIGDPNAVASEPGALVTTSNPDLSVLEDVARRHLAGGVSDYPNPNRVYRERAKILADLIRESPSGHYSPRAAGMDSAYGMAESELQQILKEAGSSAEIRDIELPNGQVIRGIEIDPELAIAAKRGLKLPYAR